MNRTWIILLGLLLCAPGMGHCLTCEECRAMDQEGNRVRSELKRKEQDLDQALKRRDTQRIQPIRHEMETLRRKVAGLASQTAACDCACHPSVVKAEEAKKLRAEISELESGDQAEASIRQKVDELYKKLLECQEEIKKFKGINCCMGFRCSQVKAEACCTARCGKVDKDCRECGGVRCCWKGKCYKVAGESACSHLGGQVVKDCLSCERVIGCCAAGRCLQVSTEAECPGLGGRVNKDCEARELKLWCCIKGLCKGLDYSASLEKIRRQIEECSRDGGKLVDDCKYCK